jgi:hypothetical protein
MSKPPFRVISMSVHRPAKVPEQRYVFNAATGQYQRHQPVDRFVRTIPYDWLHRCNRLPGKTTTVALVLWFLAGVNRNMSFRLTREAVTLAGCSRGALYHGLKALEGAGLVAIQRRPGARPIITINKSPLPVEPEGDHFDLEGILL